MLPSRTLGRTSPGGGQGVLRSPRVILHASARAALSAISASTRTPMDSLEARHQAVPVTCRGGASAPTSSRRTRWSVVRVASVSPGRDSRWLHELRDEKHQLTQIKDLKT
jgi:hypothetical protein